MGPFYKIFRNKLKRILAITAFIFAFSYYDPFGVDTILEQHSNDLFYRIIAPMFDKNHNSEITVVLLREMEIDEGWPVSYDYHADVLQTILDNDPKAIFVNLIFESVIREGFDDLKSVLDDAKKPIYIGVGRDTTLSNGFFDSTHNTSVTPVSIVINSKQGIKYPLTNISNLEKLKDVVNSKYSEKLYLSLPAQLYCSVKKASDTSLKEQKKHASLEKKCIRQFIKKHGSQNFHITWSDPSSDMNDSKIDSPIGGNCKRLSASTLVRSLQSLALNIVNGFSAVFAIKPAPPNKQNCVPHQTISVKHLFNDKDRGEIEKLIKGQYVFYGVLLENTNDIISPPTHTALPGVYVHTMALENFLSYQKDMIVDDYYFFDKSFLSRKVIWTLFVAFILVILNEYFRFVFINVNSTKRLGSKKKHFINSIPLWLLNISITLVYLIVVSFTIFVFAMRFPFLFFSMAPLSGFDFAVAVGFINLPNAARWWANLLERIGLGDQFD